MRYINLLLLKYFIIKLCILFYDIIYLYSAQHSSAKKLYSKYIKKDKIVSIFF